MCKSGPGSAEMQVKKNGQSTVMLNALLVLEDIHYCLNYHISRVSMLLVRRSTNCTVLVSGQPQTHTIASEVRERISRW